MESTSTKPSLVYVSTDQLRTRKSADVPPVCGSGRIAGDSIRECHRRLTQNSQHCWAVISLHCPLGFPSSVPVFLQLLPPLPYDLAPSVHKDCLQQSCLHPSPSFFSSEARNCWPSDHAPQHFPLCCVKLLKVGVDHRGPESISCIVHQR